MRFGSNSVIDWDRVRQFDTVEERVAALRVYARAYEAHRAIPTWNRLIRARFFLAHVLRAMVLRYFTASERDMKNMTQFTVGFISTLALARAYFGF